MNLIYMNLGHWVCGSGYVPFLSGPLWHQLGQPGMCHCDRIALQRQNRSRKLKRFSAQSHSCDKGLSGTRTRRLSRWHHKWCGHVALFSERISRYFSEVRQKWNVDVPLFNEPVDKFGPWVCATECAASEFTILSARRQRRATHLVFHTTRGLFRSANKCRCVSTN